VLHDQDFLSHFDNAQNDQLFILSVSHGCSAVQPQFVRSGYLFRGSLIVFEQVLFAPRALSNNEIAKTGEWSLPEYRIFRLDSAGKNLGPSKTIVCENDDEAINKVRGVVGSEVMEIWEGPRRVATIRPYDQKPTV
jgi:hypothetical protein